MFKGVSKKNLIKMVSHILSFITKYVQQWHQFATKSLKEIEKQRKIALKKETQTRSSMTSIASDQKNSIKRINNSLIG